MFEWTHVRNRHQEHKVCSHHLRDLSHDAANHNVFGVGIPCDYSVVEVPSQHQLVQVDEVCSGESQRDEFKLKPVTVSSGATAGSRALKTLALCFPQFLWH